jgi:hypothetical protein
VLCATINIYGIDCKKNVRWSIQRHGSNEWSTGGFTSINCTTHTSHFPSIHMDQVSSIKLLIQETNQENSLIKKWWISTFHSGKNYPHRSKEYLIENCSMPRTSLHSHVCEMYENIVVASRSTLSRGTPKQSTSADINRVTSGWIHTQNIVDFPEATAEVFSMKPRCQLYSYCLQNWRTSQ